MEGGERVCKKLVIFSGHIASGSINICVYNDEIE